MRYSRFVRSLHSESGFSLVELLGVAVIMIILALIALPVYAGATDTTREARSREEIRLISQAVDTYYSDTGAYPKNLATLVNDSYLKRTSFKTAWPALHYFFAYTTDEKGHTVYVVGVPKSSSVCTDGLAPNVSACEPDQDAPTIKAIDPTTLLYPIVSR